MRLHCLSSFLSFFFCFFCFQSDTHSTPTESEGSHSSRGLEPAKEPVKTETGSSCVISPRETAPRRHGQRREQKAAAAPGERTAKWQHVFRHSHRPQASAKVTSSPGPHRSQAPLPYTGNQLPKLQTGERDGRLEMGGRGIPKRVSGSFRSGLRLKKKRPCSSTLCGRIPCSIFGRIGT